MGPGGNVKINSAPVLRAIAEAQTKIDEGIALFAPFNNLHRSVGEAVLEVRKAASGSSWGYHSTMYLEGFRAPFPGEEFDAAWGVKASYSSRTRGPWRAYEHAEVETEVLNRAGVSETDWKAYCALAESAERVFVDARTHALPTIETFAEAMGSSALTTQANKIAELVTGHSMHELARAMPTSTTPTYDHRAAQGGRPVPAHSIILAHAISVDSRRKQLEALRTMLRTAENQVSSFVSIRQSEEEESMSMVDKKKVFVVHGRNEPAREAVFAFLRALHLQPIEWEHAHSGTGSASPLNWEVVENGFKTAQAFVILFTGDDWAQLSSDLGPDAGGYQPRPNVLIEAGMALQMGRQRTVIVQIGVTRVASDLDGINELRYTGDDAAFRKKFVNRLRTAGCDVDDTGTDWLTTAGNFVGLAKAPPPAPAVGAANEKLSRAVAKLTELRDEASRLSLGQSNGLDKVKTHVAACVRAVFPKDADERIADFQRISLYPFSLYETSQSTQETAWNEGRELLVNQINGWLVEIDLRS